MEFFFNAIAEVKGRERKEEKRGSGNVKILDSFREMDETESFEQRIGPLKGDHTVQP